MSENNKDYIINIRVSRATYENIRQKAKENRESISNVVRKAINDSAEIISDLSNELFGKKDKFRNVVGYHKSRAAKEIKCSGCGAAIGQGDVVTIGETEGTKKYFFCGNCK